MEELGILIEELELSNFSRVSKKYVYENLIQIRQILQEQGNIDTVSKRVFLVEFVNYKAEKKYKDCFIAINETDVAQQIRDKHKDKFTSYQIIDSYNC